MLRCMLKAKIHRATVTDSNINYEGSITVDAELLEAAGIRPYEKVSIADINNGERFETYVIAGERGSGVMCVNGAAARKVQVGDLIILFGYGYLAEGEVGEDYAPTVVQVDERNRIVAPQAVAAGAAA
ncbi:MAG: aspartate 1-decarboxylase [Nitrospirae bacterium]|nr:MAG: aspartate 1-decarboxylase [Nitrospirota bacterium]